MAGPNFVLDKGYRVGTASVQVKEFEAVTLVDGVTVKRTDVAGARVLGVSQYDVPTTHQGTGRTVAGVRLLGISRGIAGAAIAVDASVAVNASGRFVTAAGAAGTTVEVVGRALTAASANGDHFDLFLTPGASARF